MENPNMAILPPRHLAQKLFLFYSSLYYSVKVYKKSRTMFLIFYLKYCGVFIDIQSKSWRIIEEAPMLFEEGPASIIMVNAYLGFSYGKKPIIQELTLFLFTPSCAVPVLAATFTYGTFTKMEVPTSTLCLIPSCTTSKYSFFKSILEIFVSVFISPKI